MKKMQILRSYLLITVMSCFIGTALFAQNAGGEAKVVRGKVINKGTQAPIEHVSVTEVDADGRIVKGANTDIEGNFALKLANPAHKLSFSYIGFKTITYEIKNKTTFNVSMEPGTTDLDEVVIVANRKTDNGNLNISNKDMTVAVARINAKELEEMSSASIDQALQGRLAGVDITSTSGDPGAGMSIRIRGTSSINANTNPLIVVDGMPYETSIPSDFNFGTADDQGYAQLLNIAPSDIKEITVLKDAAATAMWGSRAANGVLLITTKRCDW